MDDGHDENQCYDVEERGYNCEERLRMGRMMMIMWTMMSITMLITLDHDDKEGHYLDHNQNIHNCQIVKSFHIVRFYEMFSVPRFNLSLSLPPTPLLSVLFKVSVFFGKTLSPLFEESHPACLPVCLFSCFSVSRELLSSRDHETRKYLISVSQDYDGGNIDFDFSVIEDFKGTGNVWW